MKHANKAIVALMLTTILSGCGSNPTKNTTLKNEASTSASPVVETTGTSDASMAETYSANDASAINGEYLSSDSSVDNTTKANTDALAAFPSSNVIYYDFDSTYISESFASTIGENADYLTSHPNAHVSIEGHADERGSREYNMGLGEKRAKAVYQILTLQGVPKEQLSVVSYGEEKAVAFGHNETSWRLNRRAELVYTRR